MTNNLVVAVVALRQGSPARHGRTRANPIAHALLQALHRSARRLLLASARSSTSIVCQPHNPEQIYLLIGSRTGKNFQMKTFSPILLACALAISSFAQETKTNA